VLNRKQLVIRLLTLMKRYYSLREMEKILGIPYQVLWKYVNLVSVPERETAERILEKLREKKVIESIIESVVEQTDKKDLHTLVRRPGFLSLYSFLAGNIMQKRMNEIDIVVQLSIDALSLAAVVSVDYNVGLCPTYASSPLNSQEYIHVQYRMKDERLSCFMYIPKKCIYKKESILFVDLFLDNFQKMDMVLRTLPGDIEDKSVLTIFADKSVVENVDKHYGDKLLFYYLKMII
jgi:adenine/guanine phosphoribosyltransferase-like PRPP-binding protein